MKANYLRNENRAEKNGSGCQAALSAKKVDKNDIMTGIPLAFLIERGTWEDFQNVHVMRVRAG